MSVYPPRGPGGIEALASEAAVQTHLAQIYAKLGVSDRAAAVAKAFHRGLLIPGGNGVPRRLTSAAVRRRCVRRTARMQTWETISSRRNVRSFADRPIGESDIDRILEAGRRSPSSRNWQPWDFILIAERGRLRQLATVWRGAGHVAGSAATIAMIAPAEADTLGRAQYDLGQATMSIMLAAADLGIGSCHSAVGDQDLAREILGLPQDKS